MTGGHDIRFVLERRLGLVAPLAVLLQSPFILAKVPPVDECDFLATHLDATLRAQV